jgi:hypothetical protein
MPQLQGCSSGRSQRVAAAYVKQSDLGTIKTNKILPKFDLVLIHGGSDLILFCFGKKVKNQIKQNKSLIVPKSASSGPVNAYLACNLSGEHKSTVTSRCFEICGQSL